jgi:hypothetical protein
MNNISLSIVLLFVIAITFVINKKNEKIELAKIENEQERYCDFVKSFSSINIKKDDVVSVDPLPEQRLSDIIDVYDADPERLLKGLKQKNDDIENQD